MILQVDLAGENHALELVPCDIAQLELCESLGRCFRFDQERVDRVTKTGRIRGENTKSMNASRNEARLLRQFPYTGRLGDFVCIDHARRQFPGETLQSGTILANNRYALFRRDGEYGDIVGLIDGVVGLDAVIAESYPPFHDRDPGRYC